jgi:hypothetical protein
MTEQQQVRLASVLEPLQTTCSACDHRENGIVQVPPRSLSWPKITGPDGETSLQQLIRCMSWKTTASEPESPTMQSSMVFDRPELESLSENSQLQLRWDRAMCKQLGYPLGYGKVSVLLVKWNEEEDEFKKTGQEVSLIILYFPDGAPL